MNEQLDIEGQAHTWDGEPLWSLSTVEEQPLFTSEAFAQMRGQTAIPLETEDVA